MNNKLIKEGVYMKKKQIILMIIGGIILLGIGFGGGVFYQKKWGNKNTVASGNFMNGAPNGQGTPPSGSEKGFRGTNGGGNVSGEIISKADNSITVKTSDGSTKIVYFTDSTKITKSDTGNSTDLSVGTNVVVNGSTNTDSSIAGNMIRIEPKTTRTAAQ